MFSELTRISHRLFVSNLTKSLATIISIGILYSVITALIFITNGLIHTLKNYSNDINDGEVYLLSEYEGEDDDLIERRAKKYQGEKIKLSQSQLDRYGIFVNDSAIILKFTSFTQAEQYYNRKDTREFGYVKDEYHVTELFSRKISAKQTLENTKNEKIIPVIVILVIASMLIFIFVISHIISSDDKIIFMYRSLGATKKQIFFIYFSYIQEICFYIITMMFIVGGIMAGLSKIWINPYFTDWLLSYFPGGTNPKVSTLGFNEDFIYLFISLFISSFLSFLLCIDQFFTKKISQRIKGA